MLLSHSHESIEIFDKITVVFIHKLEASNVVVVIVALISLVDGPMSIGGRRCPLELMKSNIFI